MSRRLLLLISALGALLALPAFAGAAMVYQSSGAITTQWDVSTDENDAYTSDVTSDGNLPIYMADDDGGNRIKLPVTGQFPMVSPNGAMVAYQKVTNSKTGTAQLHFLNVATGVDLNTRAACGGAVWAPNSSAVACSTTGPPGTFNGFGLSTITTAGVVSVLVPSVGMVVNGYSWSPDSTKVVWGQSPFPNDNTTSRLRWLPANGSGAVGKLGKGAEPIWGPTKIAFVRYTDAASAGMQVRRTQIWTLDPTVGASSSKALTAYRATGLKAGPLPLLWTPDGTRILGQLDGEDYSQPIYVTMNGKIHAFGPSNAGVYGVSADSTEALVVGNLMGGGKQPVYASPLGKMASSLLLKDAWEPSVTANWQP
jgi:hypothetical protein